MEQIDAVSKALAPDSVTSILGPPGTGKTSVIAEIAAQLASRGKRVLISAQSNLAVDNALEKVTEVESIFAVRIGRPESVKLNPELLLDRSSARYRDRLLVSSARAEELMTREVNQGLQDLPSEEYLNTRISHWERYRKLQAAFLKARATDQLAFDVCTRTAISLRNAESHFVSICTKSNLEVTDSESFIQVARRLKDFGVAPEVAYASRARIIFAQTNRAVIQRIAIKATDLTNIGSIASSVGQKEWFVAWVSSKRGRQYLP